MKRIFCLLICTLLAMHPAFAQSDSIAHKDSSLFFMLNANELSSLSNSINPEYLQNFSNLNFYLSSKQFNFNALEGGLLASYSLSSQRYTPLFNPMLCRSYFKEKVPEPLNFTLAANSPFTFLQYWQSGPADDVFQSLKLVHAQRFGKALLAGFQGSAINSKGFVDRQESKLYDFSIWSKLETKNYSLFVKAFALSSKNQENGGLSNDSAFIRKEYDMPRFDCDVNLTDAQTVLNGKSLFILNSFSLPADSLVSKNKIRLDFNYNQSSRLFTYGGSNLAYFNELGFDTIVNVDSTHFMNLDASLSYHFERLNPSFLKSGIVSFSHSAAWYYFNDSESENTGKIAAQVKLHPGSSSDIHVMAMYSPYGRTANDFSLSTKFLPGDSCSWALDFLVSSTTPDWFLIQYLDAYFNISAPGKENFIRLGLESSWLKRKLNTKLFIGSIENIAYFNLEDDYTVISDQSLFTEASLNFTWKPGILHWENDVSLQYSNQDRINYPSWMLHSKVAVKSPLFHKKAHFYIGLEAWANAANYLPFYNPVLSYFGQQRVYKQSTYPVVNVFMLFEIKSAKILLQFENLSGLMFSSNLMSAYEYPFHTPRFGVGINWYAFD